MMSRDCSLASDLVNAIFGDITRTALSRRTREHLGEPGVPRYLYTYSYDGSNEQLVEKNVPMNK